MGEAGGEGGIFHCKSLVPLQGRHTYSALNPETLALLPSVQTEQMLDTCKSPSLSLSITASIPYPVKYPSKPIPDGVYSPHRTVGCKALRGGEPVCAAGSPISPLRPEQRTLTGSPGAKCTGEPRRKEEGAHGQTRVGSNPRPFPTHPSPLPAQAFIGRRTDKCVHTTAFLRILSGRFSNWPVTDVLLLPLQPGRSLGCSKHTQSGGCNADDGRTVRFSSRPDVGRKIAERQGADPAPGFGLRAHPSPVHAPRLPLKPPLSL